MHTESTNYFNNPERSYSRHTKSYRDFYKQFLLPQNSKDEFFENPLKNLSSRSLITTLTLDSQAPVKISSGEYNYFCLFTSREKEERFLESKNRFKGTIERQLENKIERYKTKTYQLNEFVSEVVSQDEPEIIRINPVYSSFDESILFHEEIIFVPCFDSLTQKLMTSCPDEGKALLALSNDDLKRFGVEIVFHCFTSRNLPEDMESRDQYLLKSIDELNFIIPRVPVKNSSASLYCIILNFENPFIETIFIRNYKTFNKETNVIFITSNLEIVTDQYETIPYDPSSIETILRPLIEWQKNSRH